MVLSICVFLVVTLVSGVLVGVILGMQSID